MISSFSRWYRHLFTLESEVQRCFPDAAAKAITEAVRASEMKHRGEIRVVIEGALNGKALWRGVSAHDRALDLFSRLRVWDTEENIGIIIYLLMADHRVVILADRGIHRHVEKDVWPNICRQMEDFFAKGQFADGVLAGIAAVSHHLEQKFPATDRNRNDNEISDRPVFI